MTEKTAKLPRVPNYSEAQTLELRTAYTAAETPEAQKAIVESFAAKFGKTSRSIVAKLVRENVYHKAEYVTKTGEKSVKKEPLADAIGAILRLSENDTSSLAKANKNALKAVFEALANSKPLDNGEDRAGETAPEVTE